jgi:uncharacterized protein (DUF58 family)
MKLHPLTPSAFRLLETIMHNIFWALIILFAVAALLRMDWAYYLVYVVGGVWVFSHLWLRHALARLVITREMPGRAFANERLTVQLKLHNRGWLPLPWVQLQEAVPLDLKDQHDYRLVTSVGARSLAVHEYRLLCKHRGYFTVGPLRLQTGDLFGFVSARWEESAANTLIVYPEVVSLEKLGLPSRSPFGGLRTPQRLLEDPARMAGVRGYRSGDSLRSVHWKATAHTDALLVKKLDPSKAAPVTIVLDLNRNAYPTRSAIGSSEWAIVVAASVAAHMIGQRQPVGLCTNGQDPLADAMALPLAQRNGQEHLMALLSLLARVQMHPRTEELADWLPAQVNNAPWGSMLLVVTPHLEERSLWALHAAYRRGTNVLVLICTQQRDLRVLRARGERLGVDIRSVVWESDLRVLAETG